MASLHILFIYWPCHTTAGLGFATSALETTAPCPHPPPPQPPSSQPQGTLTLLLSRRHRAPALAPRAAAGLLGGVTLRLQVLWQQWGWWGWLRGNCVLLGGLMHFGDLLRAVGRSEHLYRLFIGHRGQGSCPGRLCVTSLECIEEAVACPRAHR